MHPGVLADSQRNSLRGQNAVEKAFRLYASFAFRFSDGRPSHSIPLHLELSDDMLHCVILLTFQATMAIQENLHKEIKNNW